MDDGNRIEIELTELAHPATPADPRFARPAADGDVAISPGARRDHVDRLTIWTAVGVGTVALLVGWMLGRSGNDGAAPTGVETVATNEVASSEPVTVTLPAPSSVATIAPEPSSAPTDEETRPPPPSPAAPEAGVPVASMMDVAPQLAGVPLEVIVYGNGRRLTRLDLSTGDAVDVLVDSQPFGPTKLLTGPDWVLLPTWQADLPSTMVGSTGQPIDVQVGEAWQLVGVEDGLLWRARARSASEPVVLDLVTPSGSEVGTSFESPFLPAEIDPGGGVLVLAPGGVFSVGVNGATLLTAGQLMALSAEFVVALECDAGLRCSTFVIDRTTGDRRSLPLAPIDGPPGSEFGELPLTDSISPAGTHAVFRLRTFSGTGQELIFLVDLDTGAVDHLGLAQQTGRVSWTPDSAHLLFVRGGRLTAYGLNSGETFAVSDDLFAVETFAVRPSSEPAGR